MKTGLGLYQKGRNIKRKLLKPFYKIRFYKKQKIFCIGLNKTGTTSLKKAMEELNYKVGDQREAELLFDDWVKRDFKRLINYCKTAEFFQDAPLSFPYTYIAMDQAFRGSKFILTIRDNEEQWYNSLVTFHGKLWGNGNVPPTAEDLKKANYIYPGFPYHSRLHLNKVSETDPYNKNILIDYYNTHNNNVKDYFRFREKDLLILNIAEKEAFKKLITFLNVKTEINEFPWENKTKL